MRPPTLSSASSTRTSRSRSVQAAARPAMPAPTTTTSLTFRAPSLTGPPPSASLKKVRSTRCARRMLGVRLLGMELRPPPAAFRGSERLDRARIAGREGAEPLGQGPDLIGVILVDDGDLLENGAAGRCDPRPGSGGIRAPRSSRPRSRSRKRARSCIPPQIPNVGRWAARTASPSLELGGIAADQAPVEPLRTTELALASRRGSTFS